MKKRTGAISKDIAVELPHPPRIPRRYPLAGDRLVALLRPLSKKAGAAERFIRSFKKEQAPAGKHIRASSICAKLGGGSKPKTAKNEQSSTMDIALQASPHEMNG
ncbi:MAG: hypothetical protein ISN28_02315 [Ectothiorhodospiraceae bacterium AqS1]|nr:hypothetical protein [Ectothiorhodospiraceae bacterium AqS1]